MAKNIKEKLLINKLNIIFDNNKKHIDRYINEFTFRLNEGNCRIDTIERMNSLFGNMFGKTITYRRLVNG